MKLHHAAVFAVFALGACTEETIKFVNRPFNAPPDTLSGFLGYFDASTRQTTCGNCHVGHQLEWKNTKHAQAWAGLQSAGAAVQPFCEGCHSVTELGNLAPDSSGYKRVKDAAYHDVQCENCHGPGFQHASVPDVGDKPLAHVAVDTGALRDGTCGECHSGTHTPFAEEWRQSRHGRANEDVITAYVANPTTYTVCVGCHEGRGVLKRWGVTAAYKEQSDPINHTTALGITCAVCHDPHGSPNSRQLRFPVATLDPTENLCMQCHFRRTVPAAGSSRGNTPHAPQGAVLLGEAGYQNPAYLDTTLLNKSSTASHANLIRNPRLCAGCHLYAFPTTDTAGTFNQATGHLFRPIPCYGANGLPTDTILSCAYTPAARSFRACAVSGCHASEDDAALVLSVDRQRLRDLSTTLWVDLDGDRVIDAFPTDGGYLAKIKANTTDLNPSDAIITAADGAEFNVRTLGEDAAGFLYDNGDKSHGVHNPFVAEALLRANINELVDRYTGQPWFSAPPPAVQRILDGPLGATGSVPFPAPRSPVTSSR